MVGQGLLHTFRRYRTLRTHKISALPVVVLMPHSACNCRCVMCDIWKGNSDKKQLTEKDVRGLLRSFRDLQTHRVVMSGGEALLNPRFFDYCRILRSAGIKVTLLTTGLTLSRHTDRLLELVDEVIVSLDGSEAVHDEIRQVKGAFAKLAEGVRSLKRRNPRFRVSGRCVIHRLNYIVWPDIVKAARAVGLDSISFLPADVTSEAFNREQPWGEERRQSVLVPKDELAQFSDTLESLIANAADDFKSRFILESPEKLRRIVRYYQAHYGLADFPAKRCNAPWVSAVVEPDGSVRPCFFHDVAGNVRTGRLEEILNSPSQVAYRKALDVTMNETCRRCVCSLYLPATTGVR